MESLEHFFVRGFFPAAGTNVVGGSFDIANLPQLTPPDGASVTLPYTFGWSVQEGLPSDNYFIEIWNDDDWWNSEDLGYVSEYTLQSLPPELKNDTKYAWDVAVNSPDGSYCYSFDQDYDVTFSSGTVSP
jgi:hypothetical protein